MKDKKEKQVFDNNAREAAAADKAEKEKTSRTLSKKGKAVFIIILTCVLLVALAAVWNMVAPDKIMSTLTGGETGSGYPVDIVGSKVSNGNISMMNNKLSYVSDTSFVMLNESAGDVASKKIKYSDPMAVTSGDYMLIYNQDNIGYEIDTATATLYQGDSTDSILTGDITSNGTYAIVTTSDSFASKLIVYDKENKEMYTYSFADYYINSISLSSDGKRAVLSGLSSREGVMVSAVYVLDFSAEEPLAKIDFSGNMVCAVSFLTNGNIAVIGDTAAAVITSDYQNQTNFSYNEAMLTAFDVDKEKGVALSLSLSGDGRSCSLHYISKDAYDTKADTDLQITAVDMYGSTIGVLSKSEIYTYNNAGEQLSHVSAGVDAKTLIMSSDSTAYVLGVSQIRSVILK